MCGRFTLTIDEKFLLNTLNDYFHENFKAQDLNLPSYNIAPSQQVLGMMQGDSKLELNTFQWGFIPPWWNKDSKLKPMINARSETVEEKKLFKQSIQYKRCVIFANGFYEWDQYSKVPYYFFSPTNPLFAFAAIYENHPQKGLSVALLTKPAQDVLKVHHSRSPVILSLGNIKQWINPNTDLKTVKSILDNAFINLKKHPVDERVNHVHNNDSTLIEPSNPQTLFDL